MSSSRERGAFVQFAESRAVSAMVGRSGNRRFATAQLSAVVLARLQRPGWARLHRNNLERKSVYDVYVHLTTAQARQKKEHVNIDETTAALTFFAVTARAFWRLRFESQDVPD